MWKGIMGLLAVLGLKLLELWGKPKPPKPTPDPRAVLAEGLDKKEPALVATAAQLRHEETQGLLAKWRLLQAKRRGK